MQARLFSRTGETRGIELELGRETTIGRDRQSTLVIDQPLMSSRHARIFYDDGQRRFMIEDLGSLNGTELDGDRIRGPERLGHLNVITLAGTYELFFLDRQRTAQRHADPPPARRAAPATEQPDPSQAAAAPEVSPESTRVDDEPVELPQILARRAKELGEATADDSEKRSVDITQIEREPVIAADVLAQVVRRAEAEEETAQPQPGPEGTVLEKMPIALPGNLAHRAIQRPDVHKLETVDLDDIEELIAADTDETDRAVDSDSAAASDLQLIVTEPDGRVRHFPLALGDNLLGRGTRVQVSMIYRDLSRRHALLVVGEDKITLRDLRSRNRTYLDDVRLEPEVDVELEVGARLRFGSVEARLASTSPTHQDSGDSE